MLPLSAPPRKRPNKAIQKLKEKPTIKREAMVPKQPMIKTGLRPSLSDKLPQYLRHSSVTGNHPAKPFATHIPVRLSAKAKAEMRRPA